MSVLGGAPLADAPLADAGAAAAVDYLRVTQAGRQVVISQPDRLRVTQAGRQVAIPSIGDVVITQLGRHVLADGDADTRITQLGRHVFHVNEADIRITQLGRHVLWNAPTYLRVTQAGRQVVKPEPQDFLRVTQAGRYVVVGGTGDVRITQAGRQVVREYQAASGVRVTQAGKIVMTDLPAEEVRITQAGRFAMTTIASDARVTQAGRFAMTTIPAEARITQAGRLVLTTFSNEARVTQAGRFIIFDSRPREANIWPWNVAGTAWDTPEDFQIWDGSALKTGGLYVRGPGLAPLSQRPFWYYCWPNSTYPPSAGTLGSLTDGASGVINVNWGSPPAGEPIDSVQIQRAPDVTGSPGVWADIEETGFVPARIGRFPVADGTAADTGLTPGTTYWYRMRWLYDGPWEIGVGGAWSSSSSHVAP